MSPGAEERPVSSKIWRGFGHRGPETRLKPLFEKDPEGPWPDVRHPHPGLKGRVYYASRLAAEAVLWSARIQDNQTGFFLEWGLLPVGDRLSHFTQTSTIPIDFSENGQ